MCLVNRIIFSTFTAALMVLAGLLGSGCAFRFRAEPLPEIVLRSDVTNKPSITVYLPKPTHRTGAAIVICPGGGYGALSTKQEGLNTALWFAEQGVAAILLKYRLPGIPGNSPSVPAEDAYAAIRLVRKSAPEWGIDPHRVGIIGFSAGGHLASTVGTHFDKDTRPDFVMLIYPVITMGALTETGTRGNLLGKNPDPELIKYYSAELQVTPETPPTFLAHASDDSVVRVENSVDLYLALRKAGIPAEMHIYEHGEHGLQAGAGFGVGIHSQIPSSTWPLRALEWMRQRRLLESKSCQ